MQNKKKLGVQMGWIIAVSIGVLTVILAGFGYMSFQNTFRRFYSDKAQSTAKMIADIGSEPIWRPEKPMRTMKNYRYCWQI